MKNYISILIGAAVITLPSLSFATPAEDKEAFQRYYTERFQNVPFEDFSNGVYALNADARFQWESMNDFPPFEENLEEGEELFNTAFKNGKSYSDCFENGGQNIRQNYPKFDTERGEVITLELAINECRVANNESPLPYKKGDIAKISAYIASTSEGEKLNVIIPNEPKAIAAYEAGKKYYYSKRGQLNFSCANCHIEHVGKKARSETLSTSLGHPTHFPVYRLKWQSFGTLHRRFDACNKQVRAVPLAGQSLEYRNLEYFLTYMSNGQPINAPASRK
jgi:sulfur-oxidizing protein SoxA